MNRRVGTFTVTENGGNLSVNFQGQLSDNGLAAVIDSWIKLASEAHGLPWAIAVLETVATMAQHGESAFPVKEIDIDRSH